MKVKIIKPDAIIYEGSAKLLQLPGIDGLFEILNNHAPIVSALAKGKIKMVDDENKTLFFDINSGVVKSEQNDVLILIQ
ncbi:MAG: F0F1 ATP synthase subunit epsilon [Bacteroidales bacterium]|jgi:F-type H+-transporting ATPase subunit epsilon|nr:F0F1 ATP synthase subunit epsilon [Bacteroidales bacterium]